MMRSIIECIVKASSTRWEFRLDSGGLQIFNLSDIKSSHSSVGQGVTLAANFSSVRLPLALNRKLAHRTTGLEKGLGNNLEKKEKQN